MEKKTSTRKRIMAALTVLVGALSFAYGLYLYTWHDGQTETYNAGLVAYQNGDMQAAIKFFDQSLGVYRTRQHESWTERFVYPKPDKELAAEAAFHKAKALLRAKQVKPAVESFRESLELNSGNMYQGRGLSPREVQEAAENAYIVKYDLYLLFKNNPEQAQQQGKGKGKGKPGDKADQGKPTPDKDPSGMPGKGNRDDL